MFFGIADGKPGAVKKHRSQTSAQCPDGLCNSWSGPGRGWVLAPGRGAQGIGSFGDAAEGLPRIGWQRGRTRWFEIPPGGCTSMFMPFPKTDLE